MEEYKQKRHSNRGTKNHRETTNLINNEVTISNDEEIAETFNKYFCNIAKNQKILPLKSRQ